jgi:hypothetical protein
MTNIEESNHTFLTEWVLSAIVVMGLIFLGFFVGSFNMENENIDLKKANENLQIRYSLCLQEKDNLESKIKYSPIPELLENVTCEENACFFEEYH